jgi:hypothetical protein
MGKRKKAGSKVPRREAIEECLSELPFHVVEKCLVEVWVEARMRRGAECQEIARLLKKYPSFVSRTERQVRHVPAMELLWISAAYGLRFREVIEAWAGKLKRAYEEMRQERRAA